MIHNYIDGMKWKFAEQLNCTSLDGAQRVLHLEPLFLERVIREIGNCSEDCIAGPCFLNNDHQGGSRG